MKIPILHGPRDLRIEEQPLDTDNLKPNEIWIETEITALKIGTDRGNYEGAERGICIPHRRTVLPPTVRVIIFFL